jgi:hypothetical protein
MKPMTFTSGLVGVWLLVAAGLYALVPRVLSQTDFLFATAALLMLVAVVLVKWRHVGSDDSVTAAIHDVEQPTTVRKHP